MNACVFNRLLLVEGLRLVPLLLSICVYSELSIEYIENIIASLLKKAIHWSLRLVGTPSPFRSVQRLFAVLPVLILDHGAGIPRRFYERRSAAA